VSAGPVAADAARLAAAVAWLSQAQWRDEAARLAGEPAAPAPAGDGPPTYGEVARRGVAVVEGLAGEGRWDEAASQARHLLAFFSSEGRHLGPVAAPVFDGLLAAAIARDPDELADFCELARELFP
jgi:hypothetical protein